MAVGSTQDGRSRRGLTLTVAGALLLAAGVAVLAYWAWPDLSWEIGLVEESWPYPSKIAPQDTDAAGSDAAMGNRLVIPGLGVDQQIFEGEPTKRALSAGVYRHPGTARPGEDAAVVIAGHRNRRQFALIPRLGAGDPILIYWQGQEYVYRVARTYETTPDDISVLDPGDAEELRLYTCRPRVFDDRRYVLIAEPE